MDEGRFVQGVLQANETNCFEGFVRTKSDDVRGTEEQEILVSGKLNLNRAVDSDVVVVELFPKEQWISPSSFIQDNEMNEEELVDQPHEPSTVDEFTKPTGKIVGIIKRNWKPYTGTLLPPNQAIESGTGKHMSLLFLPSDKRIPRIRIRTRQVEQLLDKILVVSIDEWKADSKYPYGHYVKSLGTIGNRESESEALLIQYDISFHPFSDSVLKCLPSLPWEITPEDRNARQDFTGLPVMSIDPPGCTDIDDALHIQELPNGNYQVGVHIADVTHFVKANTPIDAEAASRGNTVYLVDRRIDMLPKLLGENLCSLRANVERFAFSVTWEFDKENLEIVNTNFGKSVIRSRAAYTYAEAQALIDDPNSNDEKTLCLRLLNKVAKVLRGRRIERGALTLASPEVRFKRTEEADDPVDGPELYQMKETNALVEEFMLLANVSVAKKIYEHFPHIALLRRHPKPPKSNFETLTRVAKVRNVRLDVDNSKELANSLDNSHFTDSYLNTLLRIMTTRCMLKAVYFSAGTLKVEEFFHYGLAEPIYTHFTSPIRRYAGSFNNFVQNHFDKLKLTNLRVDVVVHRLLAACLSISSDTANYTITSVRNICNGA
jgi:exosome complex exonuclease DIS3/RRP44